MTVLIIIYAIAGIAGGVTLIYVNNYNHLTPLKYWIIYFLLFLFFVVIIIIINKLNYYPSKVGAGVSVLSIFITILIKKRWFTREASETVQERKQGLDKPIKKNKRDKYFTAIVVIPLIIFNLSQIYFGFTNRVIWSLGRRNVFYANEPIYFIVCLVEHFMLIFIWIFIGFSWLLKKKIPDDSCN
jgi:hypothetical protein